MKKILIIIISSLPVLFAVFITVESLRLKNNHYDKPLIIFDKVFCSKDDWICYGDDKTYNEEYWSFGFVLKIKYYLDEKISDDNVIYHVSEKEFLLFNKFRLWNWIE